MHAPRPRLIEALDTLPPALRLVVWMVDAEGFRRREVAESPDVPLGTAASRLERARYALREVLARRILLYAVVGDLAKDRLAALADTCRKQVALADPVR